VCVRVLEWLAVAVRVRVRVCEAVAVLECEAVAVFVCVAERLRWWRLVGDARRLGISGE
jgi:hypothetical protein